MSSVEEDTETVTTVEEDTIIPTLTSVEENATDTAVVEDENRVATYSRSFLGFNLGRRQLF